MSDSRDITALIRTAVERRRALIESDVTDAYRLVNADADGLHGLVIERLGSVALVQFHEGKRKPGEDAVRPAVEALMNQLGLRAAYAKYFVRDRAKLSEAQARAHTEPSPWIGEASESRLTIREHGAKFIVRPYDGFSYGLFLEHRDNRRRMAGWAKGRRVLNLFAYTCGFSVTSALGGAAEVGSVDLSKRYLEWGRANFTLNSIDESKHRFYCSDTFEYYGRAERQNRRFDLIILDPPTFARARRPAKAFVLEQQIGPLLSKAINLLDPGGILFFATNNRGMNHGRLEKEIRRAAGARKTRVIERPALPIDFAGDPEYSQTLVVEAR